MATRISALLHCHPRAVALTAIIALGTPLVLDNYRKYLALGTSGLTRLGPLGWLVAISLTAFGRETVSTAEYDRAANKEAWLEIEVERRGARPTTGWHCVPHRQMDRLPKDEVAKVRGTGFGTFKVQILVQRLDAIFEKHVSANPTLVQMVPASPHEKLDPGMVIHPDIPSPHKDADHALREIAHIHPTDHSLHVILSAADSKTGVFQSYLSFLRLTFIISHRVGMGREAPVEWCFPHSPAAEQLPVGVRTTG